MQIVSKNHEIMGGFNPSRFNFPCPSKIMFILFKVNYKWNSAAPCMVFE